MRYRGCKIAGSGSYFPGPPLYNDEIIRRYGLKTDDTWIRENLGIRSRHFAPAGEAASDLGARAALLALEDAGMDAGQLDRIILASSTADWTSPAAASNLQRLIGARCPAEDKQVACASFLFGLDHAARLLATGLKSVLVVAAEVKSRFVRQDDLRLAPIFADGAGAFVLTPTNEGGGLLRCELWTDGTQVHNMITPAGGSALPASLDTIQKNLHTTRMQVEGKQVFSDAVFHMTDLARKVCVESGMDPSRVDLFIPHQANLRIMRAVAENLNIPSDKVVEIISQTGNTVSATIPCAYDHAKRSGRILPGNLVLFATVGAGYAGGSALYRMPFDDEGPIDGTRR